MFKYQIQFEQIVGRALNPNAKGQVYTFCPLHNDNRHSLSINVAKGVWKCHAGCGQGNVFQLDKLVERHIRRIARRDMWSR